MHLSYRHCTLFDHVIEDCLVLLGKIHKKGAQPQQPTQNLQMMRAEPCDEDRNVNIMLRSGMMVGEDKGKKLE